MRAVLIAGSLLFAASAFGQETPKPALTVEQIMEKSIEATGGKAALEKMTSSVSKGTIELTAMGVTAANETYAKAPDKRLSVTTVDGYGEVLEGLDGKAGWRKDPQGGLRDITGQDLGQAQRDAAFYGNLRWKSLYPKSEVTGKEKAAGRDCWMVKLVPAEGRPVMRCFDAETFLVTRAVNPGPDGADIPVELSDYQDIGNGVKTPHTLKVDMPGVGEMVIRYQEVKVNVEIDDAKFAKPKE
jgi:hypothetical protein